MSKKYSDELKEKVVKEYLDGAGMLELVSKYALADKSRIRHWRNQYLQHGCFPDGRGKAKGGGRPRKADISSLSQREYITYLEMENAVLKQLCSLNNNQPR